MVKHVISNSLLLLDEYAVFCIVYYILSIHQLMDTWVLFTFWLL